MSEIQKMLAEVNRMRALVEETNKDITSIRNQLAEAQRVMDAQSITITKLCQAIDPTHQHGPETEKLCNYAVVNREAATQAKTGIILKCSNCNGLGQVFRYQVQDHIEYEKCHKCDGDGVDTDTVAKLFQLQEERDQLKQKLLACEVSRERMRSAIVKSYHSHQSDYSDLCDLCKVLAEPPQTSLTEALKGVREILSVPQNEIVLIGDVEFVERSVVMQALADLDKLCPQVTSPSKPRSE